MEANNVKAVREALANSNGLLEELALIGEWGESAQEQIAENNAALAKPPRACDLMTEEELSRVVSRSIVASVSARPELNEEWIKSLVGAAVTAAIKCAYDTQLKSSKETNSDD